MDELNRSFEVLKLIKRVSENMKQEIHKQFGEMNLTAPQGMLIGTLTKNGPTKVTDLSEKMCLSNSTVSGIIDRLEKCGHVQRIRSQEDRRVVVIDLTPEFRSTIGGQFRIVDEMMAKVIAKASAEEMEDIIKGLAALDRVITLYKGAELGK